MGEHTCIVYPAQMKSRGKSKDHAPRQEKNQKPENGRTHPHEADKCGKLLKIPISSLI